MMTRQVLTEAHREDDIILTGGRSNVEVHMWVVMMTGQVLTEAHREDDIILTGGRSNARSQCTGVRCMLYIDCCP